ncbi:MAG TPA: hypothetical protein PLP06_10385 [Saprospiraceae bacterium]|nr:hypothetical protein [Saprospiraceae bacterium]
MKLLYLIFNTLLLMSCHKEPLLSPCKLPDCSDTIKPKYTGLQLVWQKTLRPDNQYSPGNSITLTDDYVCFQYDYTGDEKILMMYKADTSSQRTDITYGGVHDVFYHPGVGLIVIDEYSVYTGSDLNSLHKIATVPSCGRFRLFNRLIGDYLYLTDVRVECEGYTAVFKMNVRTGAWYTDRLQKDSDYQDIKVNTLDGPAYIMNQGDTLYTYVKYVKIGDKPYITLETIRDHQTLWIDSNFVTTTLQENLIQYKGATIAASTRAINYLEPVSGLVIWSTPPIARASWPTWLASNVFLEDEKLCFLDRGHFVELDANTGSILYDSPELHFPTSNSMMSYFDGVFYWTAASGGYSWIYGLRYSDKKLVLKMRSPNDGKAPYYSDPNFAINGLHIDPKTRLAYTADGFFAQCYRIPEKY